MNDKQVYLKSNLVFEPLVDRWYAWTHLISPATAAMNITGRHMKIINSFIQAPQVHLAAVNNPKMKGGPFMDIKVGDVDKVISLKNETLSEQKDLIEFSEAIKDLESLLRSKATGYSMEPLYAMVPDILKGYVELVYDLNCNPSYRFFEFLLYNSKYYKESSQSIALWLTNNDERPFCLSTPRLDQEDIINLKIPFASSLIDDLSKMKKQAGSYEQIKKLLSIDTNQEALFESFFTLEEPEKYKKYEGDKIRMRYFGHACILIETNEISILLDPLISYYGYQTDVARFSDLDLPDIIDYVLITHNHQDHILFETLLPLRHKIKNIVVPKSTSGSLQDPNLALVFKNVGFKNVIEIGEMESIEFKGCIITGLPFIGEHSDLNIQTKICHHVRVGEFSMLFAADSCIIEPMLYNNVHEIIGDIDVLFLGMECDGAPLTWLYGPLLTDDFSRDKDQTRRLAGSNFTKGYTLVEIFNPKEVYVYAMGQEPWLEFISSIKYTPESNPILQSDMLVNKCIAEGIVAERLFGEKEIIYTKF
ncbi:MBL fold metallo-hydrolase [Pedobacter sp. D749]|uniref:MBL fold metallo-hydrolase n=1 Tax=Pedobacter sp. D749 TaxID=2856523 RepID=UPI001C593A8C|nr:MBL fold metallo-hydrolase [Pedobacter sp. D749]QXU43278.1 MBL fold metallo-hydrolase [Pedobacter sp. D749]